MSRVFESRNQMLIRFPEQIAEKLNYYFDSIETTGQKMPEIEIERDMEHRQLSPRIALKVKVDGENYNATVMELPTISSTFKTLDRVNFFKTNDISEMIVVHDQDEDVDNIREDQAEAIISKESKTIIRYDAESGITEPTKYIRQNNFRLKPNIATILMREVDQEMEEIRAHNLQMKMENSYDAVKKQSKKSSEFSNNL